MRHDDNQRNEVIFQGTVQLISNIFNIKTGEAIVTATRFVFLVDGDEMVTLNKEDIVSAEKRRQGFGTKWSVKTREGKTYQFAPTNQLSFSLAILTLSGQEIPEELAQYREPNIAEVKNYTAWLAAFSILIAEILFAIFGNVTLGGVSGQGAVLFKLINWFPVLGKLGIVWLFLTIDHQNLQRQGFNTVKLGMVSPIEMHLYMWKRAKSFGHGMSYAIVFYVTIAVDMLLTLF